jgi:hypothetical protein
VFQIALTGVKYRLFRAAVTVAVIVVAMAFLMNILTESLIKRAVADSVREQIRDLHRVDRWIARLSMVRPYEKAAGPARRRRAQPRRPGRTGRPGRARRRNAGRPAPAGRRRRRAICGFSRISTTAAAACCVGPDESVRIFDRLQNEANGQFSSSLADMKTLRFPVRSTSSRPFSRAGPG